MFDWYKLLQSKILAMRVEEFLQTLNTSIEHYAYLIKIFIASIAVLIAYNYFFVPTLLLMIIGIPMYIYTKTRKDVAIRRFNTDWTAQIPPVELAAPAIESEPKPTLQA